MAAVNEVIMQACEVCGWDTRAGARVCSACRLERGEADGGMTAAGADPNGSSLLQDLLTASHERSGGGGTATAVRQLHDGGGSDGDATSDGPHINGAAASTVGAGSEVAGPRDDAPPGPTTRTRDDDAPADPPTPSDHGALAADGDDTPVGPASPTDHGVIADDDVPAGPATDDAHAGTDGTSELDVLPPVAATEAESEPPTGTAPAREPSVAPPATGDPEPPATDDLPTSEDHPAPDDRPAAEDRSGTDDEAPRSRGERARAAFERAGAWTGVAQLALLVLGMLCVFQIVVLVVVHQFLSQSGRGAVATADALAAHGKVTGTMFPVLAVVALAVAVFAGSRAGHDSGRGGVHRRVAGLPPTLWVIVAAATAVLTMGLLDATAGAAQARDVTVRAIVVCSVLGLAAFAAPRGFAAPEPTGHAEPSSTPAQDGAAPTDGARRLLARGRPEPGSDEGSAPADDGG